MAHVVLDVDRWAKRRTRALELRERWPFAEEVLAFYGFVLDAQQAIYEAALSDRPRSDRVAEYAAEKAMPRIIDVSATHGTPALVAAVLERFHEADFAAVIRRWLRTQELPAVERYLARAAAGPVLEALGEAAGEACTGPRDDHHCPVCGGGAQLSYFAVSTEDLVTPHRYLECSRCAATWAFARMTCASCGETEAPKLPIYGEIGSAEAEVSGNPIKMEKRVAVPADVRFPHMRVDACRTCARYTITVNLERDAKAVPSVDEIAAIPLTLYANERGMVKNVPNLMGF